LIWASETSLGCLNVSGELWQKGNFGCATYQVADHDLALARQASALGGSGLGCIARRLCGLLNATGRSSGGGASRTSRAALRAATALVVAALAGEDLIQTLVELAGHDGDERARMGYVWFWSEDGLIEKHSCLFAEQRDAKT
jgi:hypothetical protein